MQTNISHIQLNVHPTNLAFYKELMALLGWRTLYDDPALLGVADSRGGSLWFDAHVKEVNNDYDGPGMNHLGIGAPAQADVDTVTAFLEDHGVPPLFGTPRHRPDFEPNPAQTYYQVMFESPDRILFEVVYTGPKSA